MADSFFSKDNENKENAHQLLITWTSSNQHLHTNPKFTVKYLEPPQIVHIILLIIQDNQIVIYLEDEFISEKGKSSIHELTDENYACTHA